MYKRTSELAGTVADNIIPLLEELEMAVPIGHGVTIDVPRPTIKIMFDYNTLDDELTIKCSLKKNIPSEEFLNALKKGREAGIKGTSSQVKA